MILKTRTLTLMAAVFIQAGCCLNGQQNKASIIFDKKDHNFGTFRESDGVITHTFEFTNTGDLPLIINNVTSTCGCTTPEWPHNPVIPGETGIIKVAYDPKDRPGSFTRSVVVNSNAETPVVNLVVKGVVIPVDLIEEVYQYQIGDLRFETIYAAFGEIYKGNTVNETVRIYNPLSDKTLAVDFPNLPGHISISVMPEILQPLQEGIIQISFLAGIYEDWDYVVNRLDVSINGETITGGRLYVTANIREDFSYLTSDDLSNSPLVSFDNTTHDFGRISADKPVSHDFLLTNLGKSDLYIRKVSASCGCTAVQPESMIVRPNNSISITAVFDPEGQGEGNQKKAITVITSDPKHSKTILWIEAFVENADEI